MYSQETSDILVTASPHYEDDMSTPFEDYYVWSYNIKIQNKSAVAIKITHRSWVVVDNKGQIQEVSGEGIIGLQPVIKPGNSFEYSSNVHLGTPSGIMMGTYEVSLEDGKMIEVEVPSFSLDCPHIRQAAN